MEQTAQWTGETECASCGNYMTKGISTNIYSIDKTTSRVMCFDCVRYFVKLQLGRRAKRRRP